MQTHLLLRTMMVAGSFVLATIAGANAQTAVGWRFGSTSGVTIQTGTTNGSLVGILGISPSGYSLTGLYEKSKPAFTEISGFSWYYGIGGHMAFHRDGYYYDYRYDRYYLVRYYYPPGGGFGLGIDGIFGLAYKFYELPISITLDLKPYLELSSSGYMYMNPDPGLGLKFVF